MTDGVTAVRDRYDVIVAGGGPAGATAALLLARQGLDVLVAERARFPRFHVGESLLPRNMPLFRELGLVEPLRTIPRQRKLGAEFAFGNADESIRFRFADGLLDPEGETFNVERAPFDALLLAAARRAGATVVEGTGVRDVLRLAEGDVAVRLEGGTEVAGRVLLDASGQSTLVGKHLGIRQVVPGHRKVAYFGHFRGVERLPGEESGHPCIVMMADGWFWLIGIDDERTSIGLVMDADHARRVGRELGVAPPAMLSWGISRCPFVARRTAGAKFPAENRVGADFSYRCRPYAGPGYFLLGDAASFLDPIFSSGICLAMVGAGEAAAGVRALFAGARPSRVQARYRRLVERTTRIFFRLVHQYYQPAFRELMMEGQGPFQVHRALFTILGGYVYPAPSWSLRWRLRAMEMFTLVQRLYGIVPHRPAGHLYPAEAPDATGTAAAEAAG